MKLTRRNQAGTAAVRHVEVISLTELLRRQLVDRARFPLGCVDDVVADRCDGRDLKISGLVAGIDDRQALVPMQRLMLFDDAAVIDSATGLDVPHQRRPTELLLVADVLGRRLLDARIAKLVRAVT